jgi:transcription-repair coupling factor (superfamily II helicase)
MTPLLSPPLPDAASPRIRWHQLYGSAGSLALAEAAHAHPGLLLVICEGMRELDQRAAELAFYGGPSLRVLRFADGEVLPYDAFSPLADITSERLATLADLPHAARGVLLVTVDTLLQRLPPRTWLEGRAFELHRGGRLALEPFRQRLVEAGYAGVSQVASPGEFALRGSLFDVFPMGAAAPLRIDLFDEEIDTIRSFDRETQRSGASVESIRLLPAREVPLDAVAIRDFRRRWRTRFEGDPTRSGVYRAVSDGHAPPGIEGWLPLFFDATATLLDYVPPAALVVETVNVPAVLERAWAAIGQRYEDHRHDIERPLLAPVELFVPPEELLAAIAHRPGIEIDPLKSTDPHGVHFPTVAPRELRLDPRADIPLAPLDALLAGFPGRVLVAADSPGRREVLLELFRNHGRAATPVETWNAFATGDVRFGLTVAPDVAGLTITEPPVAVLAESQLFGARARQARRRRAAGDPQAILRDLRDLGPGAPVVHEAYGVGRYIGLEPMTVAGEPGEFLVLEYRDGDRVYVPVHAMHFVSRYTGADPEHAPLHKLGTDQWARARRRAAEQVRDVAAELLDLYAQRKARTGLALATRELEYQAFADAFPFEETAEQAEAIQAVVRDLGEARPMDRIVCGDVGFGKTEVAMRAAFVAVQSGRQVVVLVPTTLLAQQHLANFRDRFADWPVRIESLSRFRTGGETDDVLSGLGSGTVDIVIATHRLLHADVRFKALGLLVIDEEHRFGVRDKERIKALRAEVHVLTLTATPIPRTLNLALGGLRDLSLITTPPSERLPIKTFVTEWQDTVLREAMLRELRRGGQVYFVHNEVRDIEKVAARVRALVPEAEVRVGHGQMRERDLEQLMVEFTHRKFSVLVCTTIIESGIDVPTANTIIIDRADRLGLAQLHQLRGRVGRSHHRAYAYLVTPSRAALSDDAAKRLEAIESLEELGAGFVLATHDLEIRGAGELLGESQSGQVTEIGLTMYLDMLDRAVRALKEGREPALDQPLAATTEIELRVPAFLPPDYVGDVHLRLALYKRIAACGDSLELDDLAAELVDRFGALPPATQALLKLARLKLEARALGIRKLDLGPQGGYILFEESHRVDPRTVIRLVQDASREFRLEGPLKLRVSRPADRDEDRFSLAARLLAKLATPGR